MGKILDAIKIVFAERKYLVIGVVTASGFAALFIFGTGFVAFFPQSTYIELDKAGVIRLATLVILVILAGLVLPMQIYALKKAKAVMGSSKGTTVSSFIVGLSTMSCCAPFLLPALLSFIGFSGVQILTLNITIRQYLVPLSALSIGLLLVSLFMVARSIVTNTCKVC